MISPSSLVSRFGGGGRLVAYFKAVCLYFVVGGEGMEGGAGAVAAKCAPVVCLLITVLASYRHMEKERAAYAARVALGLALSALGDALLVWPAYFVAGLTAFFAAHLAYLRAFGFAASAPRAAALAYCATSCFLPLLRPRGVLQQLVPLYALVLATVCWRGVARGGPAAAGAVLFLLSDAALGYSMFAHPFPYSQVVVMSTYYLAQLGIALSALDSPPPAPSPQPAPAPSPSPH